MDSNEIYTTATRLRAEHAAAIVAPGVASQQR